MPNENHNCVAAELVQGEEGKNLEKIKKKNRGGDLQNLEGLSLEWGGSRGDHGERQSFKGNGGEEKQKDIENLSEREQSKSQIQWTIQEPLREAWKTNIKK